MVHIMLSMFLNGVLDVRTLQRLHVCSIEHDREGLEDDQRGRQQGPVLQVPGRELHARRQHDSCWHCGDRLKSLNDSPSASLPRLPCLREGNIGKHVSSQNGLFCLMASSWKGLLLKKNAREKYNPRFGSKLVLFSSFCQLVIHFWSEITLCSCYKWLLFSRSRCPFSFRVLKAEERL